MFQTDFVEVDLSADTERRGVLPIYGSERTLVRALRGRFCFDFGMATACLKTTVSLRQGERYTLSLSIAPKWGTIGHERVHEVDRTITYEVAECDSVRPVLVFDDAELQVYEGVRTILGIRWTMNETRFIPVGRPVLAGNKVIDDPACGCSAADRPTGGPDDRISLLIDAGISRILRTASFAPPTETAPVPDPSEAASQAAQALDEIVGDSDDVGIVGMHGETAWLTGPVEPTDSTRPVLLSTDCNAAVRGRVLVQDDDAHYPVLAAFPGTDARTGTVTVFAEEPDGGSVRFLEQEAALEQTRFTTAWAGVDFSELPAGTSGHIELQLADQHGEAVGSALREPFFMVHQPVSTGAEHLVSA